MLSALGKTNVTAGFTAAATNEAMLPVMVDYLKEQGITEKTSKKDFDEYLKLGSTIIGAIAGGASSGQLSGAAIGAATAQTATTNNYLMHTEIQKANAALAACEKQGGDVSACQMKVVSALQDLDKSRNIIFEEALRIAQSAELQIHSGCKGEIACIQKYQSIQIYAENYVNDVLQRERNGEITFEGYHPSLKIDALLLANSAKERGQSLWNYLDKKGVSGTLSDVGNGLWNIIPSVIGGAKDFITAPIPAQQIEREFEKLTQLTAKDAGALAFDTATGMALGYAGGKVLGWTIEKGWAPLAGKAAEKAEDYLKKQGFILSVMPDGPSMSGAKQATNSVPRVFTSTDPIVGKTATSIDEALPGVVKDVNVPIKKPEVGLSSDADIMLKNGDVIEVKSGGGKGATTQVANQTKIIGDSGEVIVYGPDLKPSVIKGIQSSGTKVFTSLNDLLAYIKSKGL